jgi:hypothetical protein
MNTIPNTRFDERGASALEVILVLTIVMVVLTATLNLYVSDRQYHLTDEDIALVRQRTHSIAADLERQLRTTGSSLPAGLEAIRATNTNPDTIVITTAETACQAQLAERMPLPSSNLRCAGDVSCFHSDQWVYVYHPDSGYGEWFQITYVRQDQQYLQHSTMTLSRTYDSGAIVSAVTQEKYYIDAASDPEHPRLMVKRLGEKPAVVGEDVTDLQFKYRLTNGTLVDETVIGESVAAIVVVVEGRSAEPDPNRKSDPYFHYRRHSSVNLTHETTQDDG